MKKINRKKNDTSSKLARKTSKTILNKKSSSNKKKGIQKKKKIKPFSKIKKPNVSDWTEVPIFIEDDKKVKQKR